MVKDFIAYNNPCFSCGSAINFRIGVLNLEDADEATSLRPMVFPNYTDIDLLITYSNSLKLYIFHKTNKILTNDGQALTRHLSGHKLFLSSDCSKCYTQAQSLPLDIDLDKGLVKTVGLNTERLMVSDAKNMYQIETSFPDNKSVLSVDKLDSVKPMAPLILNLPLLPKYKFKNKEHFINKIKTYTLFS